MGRPPSCTSIIFPAPVLAHLQHGVQHVDFAGLLSGLGQSESLRGSHPGDTLHHPLHSGELHQYVLVLRAQPTHIRCVIKRLTHHLCGEAEQLKENTAQQGVGKPLLYDAETGMSRWI